MKLPTPGELVKDGKTTSFSFSRDGTLWYKVDGTDFEYPISPEEQKGGTWLAKDKALIHMRWIRKHIEYLQKAIDEANV